MKKYLIILACIVCVAITAIVLVFALKPASSQKFDNSSINFLMDSTNFVSNKNSNEEYNLYNLEISNTKGVDFSSPQIETSSNVEILSKTPGTPYLLTFKIKFDTSFSFTLKTENFEDATRYYSSTEYIQKSEINLQVSLTQNGTYTNFDNNKIFKVATEFSSQAKADGIATEYYLKATNRNTECSLLEISVGKTSCLEFDRTTGKLTLKEDAEIGTQPHVVISAVDGSGVGKTFSFTVANVEAKNVTNLPKELALTLDNNKTTLSPQIEPVYANGYSLTYASSNEEVATISNNTITAISAGTCKVFVMLDGVNKHEITVTVSTNTSSTDVSLEISPTQQTYSANYVTSFVNNTLTVDTTKFNELNVCETVIFDVNITNTSDEQKPTVTYTDSNNVLYSDAGTPHFDDSQQPHFYYIINLAKRAGSITFTFSANIGDKTLTKQICIILT